MTKKIHVICASPPGVNPGMESVDRGFEAFSKRHGLVDRVEYHRLYPAVHAWPDGSVQSSIRYHVLDDPKRLTDDGGVLVYWGDFFHMLQYQQAVAHLLVARGLVPTADDGLRRARGAFLLEGFGAATMQRSFSFGSTLLFNGIEDELAPDYGEALKAFLTQAGGVWLRDIVSALKACHLRNQYEVNCLGVDCAALLWLHASDWPQAETAGIFFGRSEAGHDGLVRCALDIAAQLDLRPVWLPWGDANAFPPSRQRFRSPRSAGWTGFARMRRKALRAP